MKTCWAALALLACQPALAELKPAASSREEMRRCLADADRLEDERGSLEAAIRRVENAQRDFQSLSGIYLAQRPGAARDKASAEAYNQKVAQLKALAQLLNERSAALSARQAEFNARIEASNQRCAVMVVRQDDQEAVLIERIRQAAGP